VSSALYSTSFESTDKLDAGVACSQ